MNSFVEVKPCGCRFRVTACRGEVSSELLPVPNRGYTCLLHEEVKARDAAVALAVLDELDAEAERGDAQDSGDAYGEAIARLRTKYSQPVKAES